MTLQAKADPEGFPLPVLAEARVRAVFEGGKRGFAFQCKAHLLAFTGPLKEGGLRDCERHGHGRPVQFSAGMGSWASVTRPCPASMLFTTDAFY